MYLRTHICPVSYEVDRVLLPLLRMRADRAVMVTKATRMDADKAKSFIEVIERGATEAGIETQMVGCDIDDFHDCLYVVGNVVKEEVKAGNLVFINISSGGRVLSHACAVVGMMWGASLYYAEPEVDDREGHEYTRGLRDVRVFPAFHIDRPRDAELDCLEAARDAGGAISKRALIGRLGKMGHLPEADVSRQAVYQAVNRLVKPLVERGWLEETGNSRSRRVTLTEEGARTVRGFRGLG